MTAALGSDSATMKRTLWQRLFPSPTGSDKSVVPAIVAMVRLLPQASKSLTIGLGVFMLVGAVVPVFFRVAMGGLVGAIPAAARDGNGSSAAHDVRVALMVIAVAFVASQTFDPIRAVFTDALGRRLNGHLRARVMQAASSSPGIAHLEDPAVLNQVALAQAVGTANVTPRGALNGVVQIASNYLNGFIAGIMVMSFSWWLPWVLIAVQLTMLRYYRRAFHRNVQGITGQAESLRRSAYFRDLALTPGAAKETRVFGIGPWVVQRFSSNWRIAMTDLWRERRTNWRLTSIAPLVFFVVEVASVGYVAHAAYTGDISLGQFVTITAALGALHQFGNLSDHDLNIHWGAPSVTAALELESLVRDPSVAFTGSASADGLPAGEVRFENVSFSYPGRGPVFDGLNLTIPVGSSLAVVGDNGAGKTTLVKLLARLYEPTGGRITVDGQALSDLDPAAWQRRVAAIFQDFTRYQLTARDNVSFGAPDSGADTAGVVAAAERAGATQLVAELPFGWDTVLSRQFTDGTDLSGGQWQRLALARALFAVDHGAGVLILDEPTASLDVRAEAELYDRFLEITRGLTTVVISHRFSTVRRADRIVVIEHGQIVEDGNHEQLLAADGRYAHMFRLQAARFDG